MKLFQKNFGKIATVFTGILVVLVISLPIFFSWYQKYMMIEYGRIEILEITNATDETRALKGKVIEKYMKMDNLYPKLSTFICEFVLPPLFFLFILTLLLRKANYCTFASSVFMLFPPILLQVAIYASILSLGPPSYTFSQTQLLTYLFGRAPRKNIYWICGTLLFGLGISLLNSYRERKAKRLIVQTDAPAHEG